MGSALKSQRVANQCARQGEHQWRHRAVAVERRERCWGAPQCRRARQAAQAECGRSVRAVQRRNSRRARAAVGRRGPNLSSECAVSSPPLRCCASDTAMTQTVSPPWLQLVLFFYFFKSVALLFSLSFHSAVLLYVRCHWLGRPRRVTSRGSFYLCDGKMIERDCGTCMCVSCERADGWSGGYRFSHVRAPAPFVPRPTLCFTLLARLSVPTDFFDNDSTIKLARWKKRDIFVVFLCKILEKLTSKYQFLRLETDSLEKTN